MKKLVLVCVVIVLMFACVACPSPRTGGTNNSGVDSLKIELDSLSVSTAVSDSIQVQE